MPILAFAASLHLAAAQGNITEYANFDFPTLFIHGISQPGGI